MTKSNRNQISRGERIREAVSAAYCLLSCHDLVSSLPYKGKNAPMLEPGKNGLILEMWFLGTKSMSPGCNCGSSRRFPALSIFFTLMICAEYQPSDAFRKSKTWECFALSRNP